MDPLAILPQEVWPMIFEKVEDPEDWLSLYRTSPTFEGIVGEERPTALLSKVFPHVEKHLNLKENLTELLGLRLVSQQWRQLVDTTLETPEDFVTNVQRHQHEGMYGFMSSERVSSFLEKFSSGTHPPGTTNPFIGRTVTVVFNHHLNNTAEAMAEFERLVVRLMETFGEHIKKLYVGTYGGTDPVLDNFLHQLQTILASFVPNLESLAVGILGTEGVHYRLETPGILEDPQQQIMISNLKRFTFATTIAGQWELLAEFQSLIVRMCCNDPDTLKAAKLIGVPAQLATYPNIDTAELTVTPRLGGDFSGGIPSNTSWPLLTRLILRLGPDMELHQVHECLKHFKGTLTQLTFVGPWRRSTGRRGRGDQVLKKFDIPRLKYLQLPLRPDEFDLLTSLSNLEFLRVSLVDYYVSPNADLSEEAKLMLVTQWMERGMLEFKVWEVLPKLGKIQLDGSIVAGGERKDYCKLFHREKYEAGVTAQ